MGTAVLGTALASPAVPGISSALVAQLRATYYSTTSLKTALQFHVFCARFSSFCWQQCTCHCNNVQDDARGAAPFARSCAAAFASGETQERP